MFTGKPLLSFVVFPTMTRLYTLWKYCTVLGMALITLQLVVGVDLDLALRSGVFGALGLYAFVSLGSLAWTWLARLETKRLPGASRLPSYFSSSSA